LAGVWKSREKVNDEQRHDARAQGPTLGRKGSCGRLSKGDHLKTRKLSDGQQAAIKASFSKPSLAAMFAINTLACGAQDQGFSQQTDAEPQAQNTAAITGGSLVTSTGAPWRSVVKLGGCSGTKLASRWYLTAWHCGFSAGQSITVTNSLDGLGGTTHTISQAVVHPTSLKWSTGEVGYDLALIQLDSTNSIPAIGVGTTPQPASQGTAVGYGCDLTDSSHNGKKQFGLMTTTSHPNATVDTYAFASFDTSPTLCSGDSGGPFLRLVGGSQLISGVNSGQGSPAVIARTRPATDWIQAVIADLPGHNNFDGSSGVFVNWFSNWCLKDEGVNQSAAQTECTMNSVQRLKALDAGDGYYHFKNAAGQCLGIRNASTSEGAGVAIRTCDGSDTDKWEIRGSGDFRRFQNKKSGKCMQTDSTSIGDRITQRTCGSTTDHYWIFSK
jgi:hypothetical protein